MKLLHWDDACNIGIERIDFQHRYFLELINWLSGKLGDGQNAVGQARYIEELMRYSLFHFFSEENLMLEIGYPALESHRQLHSQLINQLNRTASKWEAGEIDHIELLDFLGAWFLRHTSEEDTKIAKFLTKASTTGGR